MVGAFARIAAGSGAFRAVVGSRRLRRVMVAYAGYVAVEYGTWVAILVYAYTATGAASVAFVAVLQLVPCAILAPVITTAADRFRRDKVLLAGYLIQAATMLGTGLSISLGASPLVVYAFATAAAIVITVTRPTQGALLPALVEGPGQLTAANSVGTAVEGLGVLVGPAITGVVLAIAGPGEAFLGAAGILLLCAAAVSGLDVVSPRRIDAADDEPSDPGIGSAFRALARDPATRSVVAVLSAREVIDGAIDVLLVLVALELLLSGEEGAAYLQAAVGAGLSAGGLATLVLAGRRHLAPWLVAGAAVFGIGLGSMAMVQAMGIAMGTLAVAGVGLALTDVSGRTLVQRIVPDDLLNRVLGIQEGARNLALAAGSILVPPLVWAIGLRRTVVVFAALLPTVVGLAWRTLRRSDTAERAPVEAVATLQRLPLFAPLPAPDLEAIARRLELVRFVAGEAIITEGESGDRFYVLISGDVRVTRAGVAIAQLHAGDHFGEIALLRDVPRTATVTAETDTVVYALDRTTFLTAVTGDPRAAAEADRVSTERAPLDPAVGQPS